MTRQALSDEQRKAVHRYFYITHCKTHGQRAVMSWFQHTYDRSISQPQVSRILSDKYAYLDQLKKKDNMSHKKRCSCKWPELEQALFTWQQAMQQRGAAHAGVYLKAKANNFW
jgi:hypothetical protein